MGRGKGGEEAGGLRRLCSFQQSTLDISCFRGYGKTPSLARHSSMGRHHMAGTASASASRRQQCIRTACLLPRSAPPSVNILPLSQIACSAAALSWLRWIAKQRKAPRPSCSCSGKINASFPFIHQSSIMPLRGVCEDFAAPNVHLITAHPR